jgi:DNA-binding CsgD family transcriptional regulator
MLDHIFLFIYIITVGVTFAVVSLGLLYWLRQKNTGRFNTFLFIAYLAVLLLLAGVRFYWEELLAGGRGVTIGTGMAEFAGYALLLYYLPATVNHIIGRRWTGLRMTAAITASTVYFSLGAVYLLTGFLKPISLAAGFLYFLALAVILVDIIRSIPLIQRGSSRVTVLLITLLTVIFLPLVMASRILGDTEGPWAVSHSLRFLLLSLYYFWMALAGVIFYVREMSSSTEVVKPIYTVPEELPLTDRERDIAESVAQGLTYGEIAENLGISPNTVRNHVANVYKKLSVRSKVELIGVLRGERSY